MYIYMYMWVYIYMCVYIRSHFGSREPFWLKYHFGSSTILAQAQFKLTCVVTLMTLTTPQLQAVQEHPTHQAILLGAAHPWTKLSTKLVQLGG